MLAKSGSFYGSPVGGIGNIYSGIAVSQGTVSRARTSRVRQLISLIHGLDHPVSSLKRAGRAYRYSCEAFTAITDTNVRVSCFAV